MKRILIKDLFGSELHSREQAQKLFLKITTSSSIVFDFKGVSYISRSFADEFYNLNKTFSLPTKNLNDDLKIVMVAISNTQSKPKVKTSVNISRPKDVTELADYLYAI